MNLSWINTSFSTLFNCCWIIQLFPNLTHILLPTIIKNTSIHPKLKIPTSNCNYKLYLKKASRDVIIKPVKATNRIE